MNKTLQVLKGAAHRERTIEGRGERIFCITRSTFKYQVLPRAKLYCLKTPLFCFYFDCQNKACHTHLTKLK